MLDNEITEMDRIFLQTIEDYITERFYVAPFISDYVSRGLQKSIQILCKQGSDLETALFNSIGIQLKVLKGKKHRYKSWQIIIDIIKKWHHRGWLKWDWLFEKMEKEKAKNAN